MIRDRTVDRVTWGRSMYKTWRAGQQAKEERIKMETRRRRRSFFQLWRRIIYCAEQTYCWRIPLSTSLCIACISWVSIHRRAAAQYLTGRKGEVAQNFKYVQWHKARPLMIPNAMCSERVIGTMLSNLDRLEEFIDALVAGWFISTMRWIEIWYTFKLRSKTAENIYCMNICNNKWKRK